MSVMRMFSLAIPATILALVATSDARADLVTNGGFEQSNLAPGQKGEFALVNVAGWSGGTGLTFLDTPGTADNGHYLSVYPGFPTSSPVGGNFVMADGDPQYSSTISQTISGLVVGDLYQVSFYQASGQQAGFTGPTTERWLVGLGSTYQDSALMSIPQGGYTPWESQQIRFTATSTSEVLSFLALGTPIGEPPISFLDGVSMKAVPEPSSMLLMGIGLLSLAAARRHRAAKPATV